MKTKQKLNNKLGVSSENLRKYLSYVNLHEKNNFNSKFIGITETKGILNTDLQSSEAKNGSNLTGTS